MPFLILIVVLGVIAWGCFRLANSIDRRWKRRAEEIERRFRPDDLFCEEHLLGFKFGSGEFVIGNVAEAHVYRFDEMTKCEMIRNDVPIISTNRGSQIGGALLGGALFGVPGAIIGGLSGSQSTSENIKSILLKVYVDDPAHPYHEVCMFAAPGKGQKPGILNREAIARAERFYGHCLNAMNATKSFENAADENAAE